MNKLEGKITIVYEGALDQACPVGRASGRRPMVRVRLSSVLGRVRVHRGADHVDSGQLAGYPELRPYEELIERAKQVIVKP